MSRAIDRLPEPPVRRRTKIIGMGCSRTATLGLYKALEILGYHTFHMNVAIDPEKGAGDWDQQLWWESVEASNNPNSGIKPYSKADFEKWWAEYDAILEAPSYLPETIIDAYKDDPDVVFIVTDRRAEAFAKSFHAGPGAFQAAQDRFPLSVLRYIGSRNYWMFRTGRLLWSHCSGGASPSDPQCRDNLVRFYNSYMAKIKRLLPKDRTLVLKIEEGLGWDKLCGFLGDDIPDVPYPRTNDPNEFWNASEPYIKGGIMRGMSFVAGATAVAAGMGFWLMKNHGRLPIR